MRAFLLSAAAATAVLLPAWPAWAISVVIGNSLAAVCYQSAETSRAYRAALADCDRAISEEALSDKDRAATHVNRGVLRMRSGDLSGADSDFDKAVGVEGARAEAFLNKAVLRISQGQYREALPYLDRSLEAQTMRPALAYYVRGIAHEELGNVQAAYFDFIRARDLDPEWTPPKAELARYKIQGR